MIFAVAALVLLTATPSFAELISRYSIVGRNNDGSSYTGVALFKAAGQIYGCDFTDSAGNKTSGLAIEYESFLALAVNGAGGGGNLAIYKQVDDGWSGIFSGYNDNDLAAEALYSENAPALFNPNQTNNKVAGTYLLSGTNPDGSTYAGEVEITPGKGTFSVSRTINNRELTGTAIALRGALAMNISEGKDTPAAKIEVLGLFIPQDNGFLGIWVKAGNQRVGAERWVRK
jgi:hypothetical protein